MSKYIINGKNALRVTSDGRGLESTTQFGNSGSIWITQWKMSSSYGSEILELVQAGPTKVYAITDKYRLQFFYDGKSCNYQLNTFV